MTRRERLWPEILGGWGIASVVLIVVSWSYILDLKGLDTDDWMRLLEVRDWLGGQSWWDVGQHRLNGGDFPMHWSRLIDLPLAALLIPLDPLVGPELSNRITMTVIPLLTLLSIVALATQLTRQVAGVAAARAAPVLAALSIPILFQARPLRIDHHGWQVTLALVAMCALMGTPTRRAGAIAGLALAALLTVSLEGLPITVAITGVALFAWLRAPEERTDFARAFALVLGAAAVLLHVATRGPGSFAIACDAMSPPWLAALEIGLAALFAATFVPKAPLLVRLAIPAAGAIAAGAAVLAIAPQCTRGPFASLDPLVYHFWYLHVQEGLPIWEQMPAWAAMNIALPIVGTAGALFAWRRAEGEARARWTLFLIIVGVSLVLTLLVIRTGATANALAVPGAAVPCAALIARARAIRSMIPRLIATCGAIATMAPGLLTSMVIASGEAAAQSAARPSRCAFFSEMRVIDRLPPSTIFAPIDVTPEIIARTHHHAVAGGYHRGQRAMLKVIGAFTGPPAQAERIVRATGASYIAACRGESELVYYAAAAPNGFWARLARGERFDWLERVPFPGTNALVWRVLPNPSPASPRPAPTAPRAAS